MANCAYKLIVQGKQYGNELVHYIVLSIKHIVVSIVYTAVIQVKGTLFRAIVQGHSQFTPMKYL